MPDFKNSISVNGSAVALVSQLPAENVYIGPTAPPAGTPTPYLWVDTSATPATLWVNDGS